MWDARDCAAVDDSGILNWSKAKKSFHGRIWFILSLAALIIFSAAGDEFAIEDNIKEGEIAGINSVVGLLAVENEEAEGISGSCGKLFKNLLGDSVLTSSETLYE